MLAFMDAAIVEGAQVVAYPELALTPHFPARIRDDADRFFSDEVPPDALAPVIKRARGAGVTWLRPPAPGTLCADHVARAVHAAGGP